MQFENVLGWGSAKFLCKKPDMECFIFAGPAAMMVCASDILFMDTDIWILCHFNMSEKKFCSSLLAAYKNVKPLAHKMGGGSREHSLNNKVKGVEGNGGLLGVEYECGSDLVPWESGGRGM